MEIKLHSFNNCGNIFLKSIFLLLQGAVEISFLHSGHLGDVINALPIIKELSKTHTCNLYLQVNKPLSQEMIGYKHPGDSIWMSDKMVDMVLPLLKYQNYNFSTKY